MEQNLRPISVIIASGVTETISFPNQFLGLAESIIISNLDASNVARFQINGESNPLLTLSTGAFRTIDKTKINTIKIIAGAAGAVQVEAQVRLLVK